ncbi:NACHT domain-containing protein [Candidatus Leptofilum sp.]|uniref:NACHT domain-containing protein n=1 Tax=Candidatus Leptofilum sp. TaxID=3241576 RepID=UPI003B5CB918
MPKTIPPEIQTSITQAVNWLWEKYGQSSYDQSNDFQVSIYQLLEQHFDLSDLYDLCFKLSIDFENLNGQNKRDKAREIVSYCQRHDLLQELRTSLAELRPKIAWPEADTPSSTDKSYKATWRDGVEKYYKSLFVQVGFVRILGRMESEPLENVFTHVNVMDKLTAEQRYNIAKLKEEFDPRDFSRMERVRRVAGDDAVAEFPKLFILGKPGSGKTTFLKHTALRAIKHEIKKVPLFVPLKELSDSGMGIVEFMIHQLNVHRFPEPKIFLTRLLENGDGLVLFDGLDEVNLEDNNRSEMIKQINDFVYRYSDCPTLITCRIAATDYSFTQFEYVEMADFDAKQMANYIDLWFVGDDVKRDSFKKALLEDDNYKPVRELAQVPLLLALLCLVYEERNEIPPERSEIYEEVMRALLSKWDASRNIRRDDVYQQLSLGRKQKMLAAIAAKTFEQGDYYLREKEVVRLIDGYLAGMPGLEEPDAELVLQSLEAQHGIFIERARGIHSFSHLTLQEYFTARYIVDNESRGTVERLMNHVGDARWNEVFLMVASMLEDATEFGEQFIVAVNQFIVRDEHLTKQVYSVAESSGAKRVGNRPAASRSFLHSIVRNPDFDFTLKQSDDSLILKPLHDVVDRTLAFSLDHNLAIDFMLNFHIKVICDFDFPSARSDA